MTGTRLMLACAAALAFTGFGGVDTTEAEAGYGHVNRGFYGSNFNYGSRYGSLYGTGFNRGHGWGGGWGGGGWGYDRDCYYIQRRPYVHSYGRRNINPGFYGRGGFGYGW